MVHAIPDLCADTRFLGLILVAQEKVRTQRVGGSTSLDTSYSNRVLLLV